MQITSASNERIKHARRVRDGREPGLIFIEGVRLAEEAVRSGLIIDTCFAVQCEESRQSELLAQFASQNVSVQFTTPEVLSALSDTVQSQGIILLAQRPMLSASVLSEASATLFLGLDRVQDPGNMGTLIRTAEAAGVGGIVALGGSVDVFSPKVLRSSMGSAFRLPILANATVEQLISLRESHGLKIVAAAGEGEIDYTDYDWQQPTLLLLGNEGRGVDAALMSQCDARLRIPLLNGVESLNVAAAGAVMLFEAARQRRSACMA
jgi:RNA methyltransferase, TrmH family